MNALLRKLGLLFGLLLALSMALPLNVVSADNGQIENPTSEEWDVKVAIKDGMLYRLYFDEADGSNFSATPLSLMTGFGSSAPAISPNGDYVAAVRCLEDKCDLYKIATSGGSWERLTTVGNVRTTTWWNNKLYYADSNEHVFLLGNDNYLLNGKNVTGSPDGRLLATNWKEQMFVTCNNLAACPDKNAYSFTTPISTKAVPIAWLPNATGLYFKEPEGNRGMSINLFHLPSGEIGHYNWDVDWLALRPNDYSENPDMMAVIYNELDYYRTDKGDGVLSFTKLGENFSYPTWWKRSAEWQKQNAFTTLWPEYAPKSTVVFQKPHIYDMIVAIRDGQLWGYWFNFTTYEYQLTPLTGLKGFGVYNPLLADDGSYVIAYNAYQGRWVKVGTNDGSWVYTDPLPEDLRYQYDYAIEPNSARWGYKEDAVSISNGVLKHLDYWNGESKTYVMDDTGTWMLPTWWSSDEQFYWLNQDNGAVVSLFGLQQGEVETEVMVAIRNKQLVRFWVDPDGSNFHWIPLTTAPKPGEYQLISSLGMYNPIVSADGRFVYVRDSQHNTWYKISIANGTAKLNSLLGEDLLHISNGADNPATGQSFIDTDGRLIFYPTDGEPIILDKDAIWELPTWFKQDFECSWSKG